MNAQPPEIMSQFFLILFGIIAIFSYLTHKPKSHSTNLDFFEIGYIVDDKPKVNNTYHLNIEPEKKKKTASKPKVIQKPKAKTKPQFTQFEKDCINSLVSLGFGKKEAKKRMCETFQKYSPTTLQDFIQKAFKV
jgi:hypothetical protein